ncbi:amino acid adenylation domain-containing protein [Micromonospora orduensis]|uniref:Amino acid adenylation domain-containing protein n=1 Tax=Micromonospora orduensis TaxID=1420891 RepID=A0A5C4QDT5_9ACTN|nr:non-ribosomal peptide synthetase [Micromonospora orduensis]TNH22704.1 amino acid adenylation domain-containing protein [Micromonospora orduensis]
MTSTNHSRWIPDTFAAQAARTPDAVAVTGVSGTLTYAQLDTAGNQLAHHLRAGGAGPGRLVGVWLDRDAELVSTLLAVAKSGSAYLPLDPAQPTARLEHMLADAGAVVVVTTSALAPRVREVFTGRIVELDTERAALSARPDTAPERTADADSPMYVIYTSGSTGRPKGVVVTHANVSRLFTVTMPLFGFDRTDVWTLFHSYAFDFSVWEMWGALLHGGRLVVVPRSVARAPNELLDLLVEQQVTVLNQTPSAFRSLVDLAAVGDSRLDRLALRTVVFGGETLDPAMLRPWVDRFGLDRPELVDMYGITETTVHVTYHRLTVEDVDAGGGSPIGVPLSDLNVHLLDDNLEPVPDGVDGEIYVCGAGLAMGYLNRPGITAQRFVVDPIGGPGARMYRSGDLARRGPAGLEYRGRIDDQVQIRGYRVELGEIQSALVAHPRVRHAVVVPRAEPAGDTRLVAYVVPAGATAPPVADLRVHLSAMLPEYMLPGTYTMLDELPMTANGKLDKDRLPAPVRASAGGTAPRSLREELLCQIFAEVLDLPSCGVDDDFFELGGHSLTAIRLTNRIRAALNVTLSLDTLFAAPTVRGLAQRLTEHSTRLPLVRLPRPARIPLSLAQQRLWFLHQVHRDSPAYQIPLAFELSGRVDREALGAAIDDIASRHEILRTVYGNAAGEPYQTVLDPADARPALRVRDAEPGELPGLLRDAARETFDLAEDLPWRVWLFRTDPDRNVLLMVLHHIAGDGWSLGPLARDLARAYAARRAGAAPNWDDLPVQYADYALWQRDALAGMDEQLDSWRNHLRGAPDELELPFDRPRPATSSFQGDLVTFDIEPELHRAVSRLARDGAATVHMVLQAAIAALLTRLNAGTDLLIGNAIAGRDDHTLDDLIGFFVNSLVIRTDTTGDPAFAELIRRVRSANVAAYSQDVPFERLVEVVNPIRSTARHPLFQVMIASHNYGPSDFALQGLRVRPVPVHMGTAKFDLSLKFDERKGGDGGYGGIAAELEFSTDLFDRDTAERLVRRLVRLLDTVSADPAIRLSAIDVIGADERAWLLGRNDTDVDFPDHLTIAQLFEAQAERTPDAVALVQEERRWTFRELDERANQIAHVLRDLGVRVESPVGVSIYRSPELIAALLAIWKAGGAYIPTDPDYPTDRLNFMFADSGATILLTERAVLERLEPPAGVAVLTTDDPRLDAASRKRPEQIATGHNLAYIIYTSGSTGRPKSVMLEHRSATNRLIDVCRQFRLTADDVSLPVISISFEALVREVFAPLMAGGSAALLPAEGPRDPATVLRTIRDHGVTVIMVIVPSLLESIIAYVTDPADVRTLRLVGTGGEVLRPQDAAVVMQDWDCELVNQYGPTETTMMALMQTIRPADLSGRIPVGRVLANAQAYVLDRNLDLAPVGVTGEVYLSGAGIARGYRGRAGLSAERFVANRFGAPGTRMYRTGDLARWKPDGSLDFMGRIDDQVKIRGFRVELGEIEVVLAAHPAISHAAVVVREDRPGDKRLAAYYTTTGTQPISPAELRDHLSSSLPDHMIPSAFVAMDVLPLIGNGKLDVRRLPAPDLTHAVTGRAPRTPREQFMCELFAEVLGLPAVGPDDDFFALGGHSLLAARLIGRVRQTLGGELAMRSVFEAPTPAGLMERFGRDSAADALDILLPLRSRGAGLPLFCVHPGGGMSWPYVGLLRMLDPDVPLFGLQARGLSDPDSMPDTVDAMAAEYVAQLRSVQPDGPYRLLGWSFGGVIAHEMAVQLRERGAEVSLLVMLDSYPDLPALFRLNEREAIAALIDRDRSDVVPDGEPIGVAGAAEILRREGGALAGLSEPQIEAIVRTMDHNRELIKHFRPRYFDGDLLFFLATQARPEGAPTADAWAPHIGGKIECCPIDVDHGSMAQPEPLDEIGRMLGAYLSRDELRSGARI